MKIGEFAKFCGVTKDTVRYYVNVGLLIPKTQGTQLNFTKREYEDFQSIKQLKQMCFNLKEIEAFLYLRRTSNMIEPDTIDECVRQLSDKKDSLRQEMQRIENSVKLIDTEITNYQLRKMVHKEHQSGVPVTMISLLCCPRCGKQLRIADADINYKYIYNGKLSCSCGYEAAIVEGLVRTGNIYTGVHDHPDLHRKLFRDIDEEWAVCTQKCADQMTDEIEKYHKPEQIVFEANINGFFFTYNYIHNMPKDVQYIIVDKYEAVLANYKSLIENLYPELDVLYIADASEKLPVKPGSVDLFLSFYGEDEFAFYHKEAEIKSIKALLKPEALLIGSYFSYEINSQSHKNLLAKYPEGSLKMINLAFLKEAYAACDYLLEEKKIGTVRETKKHHSFTCHVDGDAMTIYYWKAVLRK